MAYNAGVIRGSCAGGQCYQAQAINCSALGYNTANPVEAACDNVCVDDRGGCPANVRRDQANVLFHDYCTLGAPTTACSTSCYDSAGIETTFNTLSCNFAGQCMTTSISTCGNYRCENERACYTACYLSNGTECLSFSSCNTTTNVCEDP